MDPKSDRLLTYSTTHLQ